MLSGSVDFHLVLLKLVRFIIENYLGNQACKRANVLPNGGSTCFKHEFKGLNFKTLALTHPLVETLQTREVLFLAVVVAGTVGRVVAT